jgi:hypothetical protein
MAFVAKKLREINQTAQRIVGSKTSIFGANDRLKRHANFAIIASAKSEKFSMPTPQEHAASHPRSRDIAAAIRSAKDAAAGRARRPTGRFELYELLETVYGFYIDWKRRNIAKRSARMLADELTIVPRKGVSPIRILIEALQPDVDFKQKSRWVRALEYVYSENVSPSQFRKFIRTRGGVASCARLAVQTRRKRRRPRRDCVEGDWDD